MLIYRSVSCFILFNEIANFQNIEGESSQRALMLVAYPLPTSGVSISDKAWESQII